MGPAPVDEEVSVAAKRVTAEIVAHQTVKAVVAFSKIGW